MTMNKIAFVLVAGCLLSSSAMAGVRRNADDRQGPPPPPPQAGETHERLCDGGNCCNFDVDGRSLNYTLRCDHPIQSAELRVGDRRPETMTIYEKGRLNHPIPPRERLSVKLMYPPKREIHARLCDGGNCCNLDVDGRSRNYTLNCDHPFDRAELSVNGKPPFELRTRGHMDRDVFEGDRLNIRLIEPPPPPQPGVHKSARDRANDEAGMPPRRR